MMMIGALMARAGEMGAAAGGLAGGVTCSSLDHGALLEGVLARLGARGAQ
jgi:hypothetical protein